MIKIVTHSGNFHPDDCFAVAVALLYLKDKAGEAIIIRSRDPEVIKTGDFVIDVGAEYDAAKKLFDHHQLGGAGVRESGEPYASFGLIWKAFGAEISGTRAVANDVDKILVAPIDYSDNNGGALQPIFSDTYPYTIERLISVLNRGVGEKDQDNDAAFKGAVKLATTIIEREISYAKIMEAVRPAVLEAYRKAQDKRIVILDADSPWFFALSEFSEPLFVVQPDSVSGNWYVSAVRKGQYVFENRKNMPKDWAGLRDEELARVSGVPDAVFCHNKLFVAVAKSKEGAIALAKEALRM